jgi:bacteriorhodopsin
MNFIQKLVPRAGNDALRLNPTVATIDITTAASDFLWMEFSVMAFVTIAVASWAQFGVKAGQRTFHQLSVMITATASVAYFCMASDLGAVPITVEFVRGEYPGVADVTRSIWYARYIDWTITTPLLLLELLLVTGLPLSDIVITIFADLVMIITGLIGALVESRYKWGFFAFGCFAMFYVFYVLYGPGRKSTHSLGGELSKSYLVGASILSFLWFLYPICWALADGGNVISPTGEMVFYGILDLLAKPVFTIVHLIALRNVDYSALKLSSGKFSEFSDLNGDVPTTNGHAKTLEKPVENAAVTTDSTAHGH